MSNIFAIATIRKSKKIIGIRIVDIIKKKCDYKDVPVQNIKQVLASGAAEIRNIELVNGDLNGTNGHIDRLCQIDVSGKLLNGSPLIIVNRIGDVGFTVCDYKGETKQVKSSDVIAYAKKYGIANGKVVLKDNVEYISAINGEYDEKKVSKSKLGDTGRLDMGIRITTGNGEGSVARNTKIDVQNDIEENDVFKAMTPNQKRAIQEFYMWYTVDAYKSMAKSVRLSLNVAKAEKLSEMRGEDEWTFNGIIDAGFNGASRCSLGHSLRYEYHAVTYDKDKLYTFDEIESGDFTDYVSVRTENGRMYAKVKQRIIFGETCSSDFFRIAVEDMRKLVKIRKKMSEEISLMADIAANNMYKEKWGELRLLVGILSELGTKERIIEIFGDKVGITLLNFMTAGMPFPETLVELAKMQVEKMGSVEAFKIILPKYKDVFEHMIKKDILPYYSNAGTFRRYLEFMGTNRIQGIYAYDPILKTGKGPGFNAKTRKERSELLRLFNYRLQCHDFDIEELKALMETYRLLIKSNEIVKDIASKYSIDYDKVINIVTNGTNSNYYVDDNRMVNAVYMGRVAEKPEISGILRSLDVHDVRPGIKVIAEQCKIIESDEYRKFIEDTVNKKLEAEIKEKQEREERERQIQKEREEKERKAREEREERERQMRSEEEKKKQSDRKEELKKEAMEFVEKTRKKLVMINNKYSTSEADARLVSRELDGVMKDWGVNLVEGHTILDIKQSTDVWEITNIRVYDDSYNLIDVIDTSNLDFRELGELDELKMLLEKWEGKVEKDRTTLIAEDIISRGKRWDELTYKQKYRIREELDKYRAIDKGDKPEVQENNKYELDKHPDIVKKLDKIEEVKGKALGDKIMQESKNIYKIINTIRKYGRASDKQMKHINKAYETIINYK